MWNITASIWRFLILSLGRLVPKFQYLTIGYCKPILSSVITLMRLNNSSADAYANKLKWRMFTTTLLSAFFSLFVLIYIIDL